MAVSEDCHESQSRFIAIAPMLKIITATALLTVLPLFNTAATAQDTNIPELNSSLQTTLCQNNWSASIRAVSLLIGSSETSPDYREELVTFRHQLQDWRATEADAADVLPSCEDVAASEEGIPIPVSISSSPLNFEAAVQSIEDMNDPYSLYSPTETLLPDSFSSRECWVIDQNGQRFDLALLCNGR